MSRTRTPSAAIGDVNAMLLLAGEAGRRRDAEAAVGSVLAASRRAAPPSRHAVFDAEFAAVYDELHRRARAVLGRSLHGGRPEIDPSSLVHGAYLVLRQQGAGWNDRAHLLASAARAMRFVLVHNARRQRRRSPGAVRVPFRLASHARAGRPLFADLIDVDLALARLRDLHPQCADIAELRAFGGLRAPEIAEILGMSARRVEREWAFARTWLRCELDA